MTAVAIRKQGTSEHATFEDTVVEGPAENREAVLARYRRLRDISNMHHSKAMGFLSGDAILHQARRLNLAFGRALVCDSEGELTLAFDLAIHTAPAGRSRAIDRYARSVRFAPGSHEALVLEAIRHARFAVLSVERRHPSVGLIVTDLFRKTRHWLVDQGLEVSMQRGTLLATRYFAPDRFVVTAGVGIPVDWPLLRDAIESAPRLLQKPPAEIVDDRRLAEAIYRTAVAEGIMAGVVYQDVNAA